MAVEKIEEADWKRFLEIFNKQHRGWYFSLIKEEKEAGKKVIADKLQLKEIAINCEPGEFNNTVYIAGQSAGGEINEQPLIKVRNIRFEKTDDGKDKSLYLQNDFNENVSIIFRSPAKPEMLDGIAE